MAARKPDPLETERRDAREACAAANKVPSVHNIAAATAALRALQRAFLGVDDGDPQSAPAKPRAVA
jgi:hypothetical protein